MLRLILTLFLWLLALPSFASQSIPVDTGKVTASLVSSHNAVPPGGKFHVALRTVLDDHWHTYWKNPGDSGEPVFIDWTIPEGMSKGDIAWPLPQTLATGPIINYGFEGTPIFPVEFTVPDTAELGSVIIVDADFYYLVCKDVCIPEQGKASLPVKIADYEVDDVWQAEINTALAATPKAGDITGAIRKLDSNNWVSKFTSFCGCQFCLLLSLRSRRAKSQRTSKCKGGFARSGTCKPS